MRFEDFSVRFYIGYESGDSDQIISNRVNFTNSKFKLFIFMSMLCIRMCLLCVCFKVNMLVRLRYVGMLLCEMFKNGLLISINYEIDRYVIVICICKGNLVGE